MVSVVSKPTPHPDQVWWQGDKLTVGTITIDIPDYKKFLLNQLQEMAVLYSAPPIPAGIHRNPPESSGILRNGTGFRRNGTGIHRNGTGIEQELSEIRLARYIYTNIHFCTL